MSENDSKFCSFSGSYFDGSSYPSVVEQMHGSTLKRCPVCGRRIHVRVTKTRYYFPKHTKIERKSSPEAAAKRASKEARRVAAESVLYDAIIEAANRQFGTADWKPRYTFEHWTLPTTGEDGREVIWNVLQTEHGIEFKED